MIMAAAMNGWIDGDKAMMESLIAFKRARRRRGAHLLRVKIKSGGEAEKRLSDRASARRTAFGRRSPARRFQRRRGTSAPTR